MSQDTHFTGPKRRTVGQLQAEGIVKFTDGPFPTPQLNGMYLSTAIANLLPEDLAGRRCCVYVEIAEIVEIVEPEVPVPALSDDLPAKQDTTVFN